jgi:hypothetical protein
VGSLVLLRLFALPFAAEHHGGFYWKNINTVFYIKEILKLSRIILGNFSCGISHYRFQRYFQLVIRGIQTHDLYSRQKVIKRVNMYFSVVFVIYFNEKYRV